MPEHDARPVYGTPHSVADILDCLKQLAADKGCISVGDMIDALGTRTYGPMFVLPALLVLTPIGAIPSAPTFLAAIIAIFAAQMMIGRRRFWVPHFIDDRRLGSSKLEAAATKLEPVAHRLDRWFHGRLKWLTRGRGRHLAAAMVLMLCLMVPPLELLPLAAAAPMLAIAMIGIALLVGDGVLLLLAMLIGTGAIGIALTTLF